MDFIIDAIVEWLKGLLVDGIMGNLDGLFNNVNQSVGEIATQVGTTPADWNAGVFSMIRQISETAILPIAGVILTFVMTYELIQMLIDRNNLHDVDTWMFFKDVIVLRSPSFHKKIKAHRVPWSWQVVGSNLYHSNSITPSLIGEKQGVKRNHFQKTKKIFFGRGWTGGVSRG